MSYSLNEVEATAKRAARGAGYDWGHAEEAAKAARWLCAQGLDGVEALALLLETEPARQPLSPAPAGQSLDSTARQARCPLIAGAILSDNARQLAGTAVTLQDVAVPALLLPFAANAARLLNTPVTVTCDGVDAVTDWYSAAVPSDIPDHAMNVCVQLGGTLSEPATRQSRSTPNPERWAVLNRFAHRTYAPATEESRLRGAGAGLSDND